MSASTPDKVNLSKYIEIRDNRANVRGRRLKVAFVASAHKAGASISELAYDFTLEEEQVLATLLYYHEHREEIDAQDALDIEESQKLHLQNSPQRR